MTNRINVISLSILIGILSLVSITNVYAESVTDQIEALIAGGSLDQALVLTDKQLDADETNVNYLFLKGLILTRQNKLDDARDIFILLTESHPELPEPYNNLAVIYAAQGDFTNARKALELAINTHPSYATAHENLGDIYAKMASKAYNQALEIDSKNITAREKLSMISELFSAPGGAQKAVGDSGRQKLDSGNEELRLLEQQLTNLTERNKQLEQRRDELQAELATLESQREKAVSRSRQELEEEQQRVEHARQQLAQIQEELAQLENRQAMPGTEDTDAAPVPVPAPPVDGPPVEEDVIKAVEIWAAYWSNINVEGYLSAYAQDYTPPDGLTRQEWIEQRRERITSPRYIQVEINSPRVDLVGPDRARVDFQQGYRSDRYGDRVKKALLLKLENGRWLILEETTG